MRPDSRPWPLVLLCLVLYAPAHAQGAAYGRAPGDTLRYLEIAKVRSVIPADSQTMDSRSDGTYAVTFAGDTAYAWHQALRILEHDNIRGPRDVQRLGLGVPYVLRFGARGVDSVLKAPRFPRELAARSNLNLGMRDFFPRLPAVALRPGLEWADTVKRVLPRSAERVLDTERRVVRYRVLGDTVLHGERVVVMETRAAWSARSEGRTLYLRSRFTRTGWEDGRVYFAPGRGVLVRRRAAGGQRWVLLFRWVRGDLAMEMTETFTRRIERLPEPQR